jgi:hypothetical protein
MAKRRGTKKVPDERVRLFIGDGVKTACMYSDLKEIAADVLYPESSYYDIKAGLAPNLEPVLNTLGAYADRIIGSPTLKESAEDDVVYFFNALLWAISEGRAGELVAAPETGFGPDYPAI